jgi:hypothetical protein
MSEPKKPHRLGRRILALAGGALLAWTAWFAWSLATGAERVGALCAQIRPGMTVGELTAFAEAHGLGPRRLTAETRLAYLAESRSFGRHACRVELERGVVAKADYNFAD